MPTPVSVAVALPSPAPLPLWLHVVAIVWVVSGSVMMIETWSVVGFFRAIGRAR
jgi:hypothetical protein